MIEFDDPGVPGPGPVPPGHEHPGPAGAGALEDDPETLLDGAGALDDLPQKEAGRDPLDGIGLAEEGVVAGEEAVRVHRGPPVQDPGVAHRDERPPGARAFRDLLEDQVDALLRPWPAKSVPPTRSPPPAVASPNAAKEEQKR